MENRIRCTGLSGNSRVQPVLTRLIRKVSIQQWANVIMRDVVWHDSVSETKHSGKLLTIAWQAYTVNFHHHVVWSVWNKPLKMSIKLSITIKANFDIVTVFQDSLIPDSIKTLLIPISRVVVCVAWRFKQFERSYRGFSAFLAPSLNCLKTAKLHRLHALWFQIPMVGALIPALYRPLIPDPIYLVTTL